MQLCLMHLTRLDIRRLTLDNQADDWPQGRYGIPPFKFHDKKEPVNSRGKEQGPETGDRGEHQQRLLSASGKEA